MDYLNPLHFVTASVSSSTAGRFVNSTESSVSNTGIEHSELAMRAAKRMRRTKHKVKTGHKVCHHLLEMIRESDDAQPVPRVAQRYHGLRHNLATDSSQPQVEVTAKVDWSSANDRQFSLSF